MSESIVSRMINCETTCQLWTTLESYFGSQVREKFAQYKTALVNTKNTTMTIKEFLLKIPNYVDILNLVSHKVTENKHINAVLEGLPIEYETFITTTNICVEPYIITDLECFCLIMK